MNSHEVVVIADSLGGSTETMPAFGGWKVAVQFPNGYGASVIEHSGSYGVELGATHGDGLCYDTPITDNVVGWIESRDEMRGLLERIAALDPKEATR